MPVKPKVCTDGGKVQGLSLGQIIKNVCGGLENVADHPANRHAKWIFSQDRDSVDDVEEEVNEMLSVFQDALPGEFKDFEPGKDDDSSSAVYRRFCNEIASYASDDQWLRHRLRIIITPSFQAVRYFEKLRSQVRETFEGLENFMRSGPSGSDPSFNVAACADRLSELVDNVREEYNKRAVGKLSKKPAAMAAAVLIDVLKGVVERNLDIFANASWSTPVENMPRRESNLFVRLIAEPDDDNPDFVLRALKNFPPDVIDKHQDRLMTVKRLLKKNGAPDEYCAKLESINPDRRKRAGSAISESYAARRKH